MKKFLFSIVISLITNTLFAQLPETLPNGNLVAWYPFCADTTDHGPTGYHLNNDNIALTTDRFGKPDGAYNFNGSNSVMNYTTTFPLSTIGGNITYSVWINPNVNQNSVILYNGNPNLDGLGIVMNDGTFGGGPGNQVSVLFGATNQVLNTPVALNQWHHLVVTRTGNGFYFYVDTVQIGYYVPFAPPGFNPVTTVFQVGMDKSDGSDPFSGKIDDIAVYDRFIGPTEVRKLYNYTPDIFFNLGSDTSIIPNSIILGQRRRDTLPSTQDYPVVTYPNVAYFYSWTSTVAPPAVAVNDTTYNLVFSTGVQAPPKTMFLTISRQYSCTTRDTIVVRHIVPNVDLGNDTIFCKGSDPLILNTSPTPGATFLWSTGVTTPTISVTTTGIYSVIVDSMGAIGYDTIVVTVADSIHLTLTGSFISPVSGTPPTPFSVLPDGVSLCQGGSYDLMPLESYSSSAQYIWQDGITISSTLNAPVTNKYWLQVSDSGCTASDTFRLAVVYDTVTIFTPDTAICLGATFVVRASSAPNISYQWTPTSGIAFSATPTPSMTPDTSAWYVVTASIVDSITNCHVRDSFFVDVQPFPQVNMGGNRNICEYDTIHIDPIMTPGWYTGYSYDWTPGTFLDDSTAPYVVFTAGDTTKLVLVVTTPAGCSGADSIIIYKYNANFASMSTDTIVCPGVDVPLFPVSSEPGVTTYVWHPGTYMDDTTSATPVIKPINSLDYVGIATSQYGCFDTLTYSIIVKPAAVITLPDSVVLFPGETYQMLPVTNCISYSWFPSIGLSDSSMSNPIASPPASAKYILTGMTEEGCITSDSINIRVVENTLIVVPNAFTPGEGVNNTIKALIKGIARLRYFRIYNRYGNLVFNGTSINDGWDGTINGVSQPMGVYVYEAEAVTDKGRIIQKQGNITLLR